MKTNKLLKSSMSVALALTISSITAQAWPTNSNIAKADFGDKAATEQTKAELNEIINKIFNDQSITNRYLGTTFFHKTSNFPYYHVTFENHQVPDDVIDTTPWYNMWSEAAAAKAKLDANSYTEKTAQNAINTLKYYIQLYNFDVNHDLKDDGFYTTTDFKTPTMVTVSSDGQQDFYKKVTDNKEEIKNLFKKEFINTHFGISLFRKTMEALKNLKFNDFEKYFQEIMLKSTSNWDTSKEAFYHGLSLGMLSYLDNDYYVTSNFEAGFGRYDVILEPKNKAKRAFILEFKVADNENKLENLSKEAIKQIEEKKYDVNLKSKGIENITFVGIAFYGKKLKVNYK